eukprot:TRINITY_DN10771_c1_g1_i1.p1 TRINITY_DN10771_c1_g1~~TRINITY_DN10771_c1_g1_i1.p1  ORF type:complete len:340 (+),score=67.62 TRINITY_DN10771_c1_g1_i1:56-1075(+)
MEPRQRRSVVKICNELDGMAYSLVFEGALGRLTVKQLKKHVQETTGVPAEMQQLMHRGVILREGDSCDRYAIQAGAELDLCVAGDSRVPVRGSQPQQLPPQGAAVPYLKEGVDGQYVDRQYEQQRDEVQFYDDRRPSPVPPMVPGPPKSMAHHPMRRPSVDPIVEKIRENDERLSELRRYEALLRSQEEQLAESQKAYRENASTELTLEHLNKHNKINKRDAARHAHADAVSDDETEILTIEELPPMGGGAKSLRSHSTAGYLASKARELELEAQWKQTCTKFDLARSSTARSMERLKKELHEKESTLRTITNEVQQDMKYVKQKRIMLDTLSARSVGS